MTITSPRAILAIMMAVNILNYVDRQIVYALLPLIQSDLRLTDTQAGSLASAFMIVYMLAAPPIAWLADSRGRKPWIVGGVGLWSLATAATSCVSGFFSLFCARALVGIGESCYGAISPSFVAEKFSEKMRSRALSLFSMAIPVGSALGYAGGGLMGNLLGWRRAIWLVAIPGLFMTLFCLALPEDQKTKSSESPVQGYLQVWRIRTFRYTTYACAAMTFALGGFAVWIPTFFHRQWGMSVGYAGTLFGAITVLGGFIGSFCGGWIADRIRTTYPDSDLIVSGVGLAAGMPLAMLALMSTHLFSAVAFLFAAEVLLFLNMGPLNSVIISVSQVRMRSMAFAANIFFMHLFGDAASPTLIGWGSDLFGLNRSLLVTTVTLGLAGWFCFQARRSYGLDVKSALITKQA